jgi:type I restriction enzyme M protein
MAIKKLELYSSIWTSCDELKGGMDRSEYKKYLQFIFFIKNVSKIYGDM